MRKDCLNSLHSHGVWDYGHRFGNEFIDDLAGIYWYISILLLGQNLGLDG